MAHLMRPDQAVDLAGLAAFVGHLFDLPDWLCNNWGALLIIQQAKTLAIPRKSRE